jgi:hypothetical protein
MKATFGFVKTESIGGFESKPDAAGAALCGLFGYETGTAPAQCRRLRRKVLPGTGMSSIDPYRFSSCGHPGTGAARLINCFKNFLIPCAEFKIRKTLLIPSDSLNKIVHLEYFHIKIAQAAAGEVKAKEG